MEQEVRDEKETNWFLYICIILAALSLPGIWELFAANSTNRSFDIALPVERTDGPCDAPRDAVKTVQRFMDENKDVEVDEYSFKLEGCISEVRAIVRGKAYFAASEPHMLLAPPLQAPVPRKEPMD